MTHAWLAGCARPVAISCTPLSSDGDVAQPLKGGVCLATAVEFQRASFSLLDDAQEYDFNIQVEEELAAYVEDEMMDDESGSRASIDRSVSEEEPRVIEQNNKRQKACPGHKRRIVTVTQWDASARQQMIRQLGQRGVT